MTQSNHYHFSSDRVLRTFDRAAPYYDKAPKIPCLIAQRLLSRLSLIRLQPTIILDCGAGTGLTSQLWAKQYPNARCISLDLSWSMVSRALSKDQMLLPLCADASFLPFQSQTVDLVISNLMLPWQTDPIPFFQEVKRILKPGGLFFFSSLGPDTLIELRTAWESIDSFPHVHLFMDLHDVGDLLLSTQFSDPVMDMEKLTLHYTCLENLCRDLKKQGANNLTLGRRQGLLGRTTWQRLKARYDDYRQGETLPATLEIVYGHAWQPAHAMSRKLSDGSIEIPVDLLNSSRKKDHAN
jgi:malonyl-CoA O-methyltransferase